MLGLAGPGEAWQCKERKNNLARRGGARRGAVRHGKEKSVVFYRGLLTL
jgi:hypothetical protein